MKILLISEYFPPRIFGGGEISAWLIAKNLAKEGLDVSVLTSYFKNLKKFEIKDGIKIYRRLKTGENPVSGIENLKRAFIFPNSLRKELLRLDKRENFDIIHCMNINSIFAVKVKKKIKKPFIAHINAPNLFCPRGIKFTEKICKEKCSLFKFISCYSRYGNISRVERKFYLRYNPFFILFVYYRFLHRKKILSEIDHFIPISSYMKNLLLEEGIPEEKISIVPNPLELDKFLNLKIEHHSPPRILYLGAYEEFKGPQVLLEALSRLNLEFEANFYGSGSLREKLKREIKTLNLNNVHIHDGVRYSEIPKIYQEHDIVVFPSLVPESFGRVAIEAMASGKPVIASRIGGVIDIIKENKNGILVEPGSIEELKNAIEKLIQDSELRNKIGKKGREMAHMYSEDKIAKKIIKVYQKMR
ncbi:MAG: hypothetical protein DRO95_06045 [Candidatus Altiarchaeales archaeon]|nr:MAG: hypothetical protein DRO95_06045 [Candidatus Altiarchaeales archaeon]